MKQSYQNIFDASFDERVSVVNLLISGLEVSFHKVWLNKLVTDMWYEFLKGYKAKLEEKVWEQEQFTTPCMRKENLYLREIKRQDF